MINIQIDSRLIKKGDTFVAIKGSIVDGHKFIESAIKNGAKKVIVSNGKQYSVETINTPDTNKYLTDYLVDTYSKEFEDLKFIGITGTNGKTTTGYLTYQLLTKLGVNAAYMGTIGFYYNHTFEPTLNTTPDILNLYKNILKAKKHGSNIIILEASSIGLDTGRMKGIKFDTAVYTNLTHDHLDYHKTMKNYLKAKMILFDNLKKGGTPLINTDDRYAKFIPNYPNIVSYGFKENCDIRCISHNDIFSKFTFTYKGKKYNVESPLFGKYNVYNIFSAIGIVHSLGYDFDEFIKYIPSLKTPKGRINIIKYKSNKIIIDYAHTPDGIRQVITSSMKITKGKTYVVFGCPGDRDRAKRPIMGRIVDRYADYFIITDDDPHYEDEMRIVNDITKGLKSNKYEVIINRKHAIKKAMSMLKSNDTLLLLGKGHENFIVIKDKPIAHNDEKYVKEVIKGIK